MGKKSAVDKAYEQGYAEGLVVGKRHSKALTAMQEQDAFNRGVQRGQELTEASKAEGILDLQRQLDASRRETGAIMVKHRELLSSIFSQLLP